MKAVLFALASIVAIDARPAAACSPPPCWPGFFAPGDATQIPANTPGLLWRPMQGVAGTVVADPANVTLVSSADPATPLAFTATALANGDFLLVPDAPLIAGDTYFLDDTTQCTGFELRGPSAAFAVGPAQPLPAQLGTLVAFDPIVDGLTVGTSSGSCSIEVTAAQVAVQLDAALEVEPWLPILQFETFVDGRLWRAAHSINDSAAPGESWLGRARDLVYAVCASPDLGASGGVAEGEHVITLRATLPGRTDLLSASSDPIVLDCAGVEPPGCGDQPCADASPGCASAAPGVAGWPLIVVVGLVLRRRRDQARRAT